MVGLLEAVPRAALRREDVLPGVGLPGAVLRAAARPEAARGPERGRSAESIPVFSSME